MANAPIKLHGDIRHWLAYRLSILAGQNTRCLAAMYVPRFGLSVSLWRVLTIIAAYEPVSASEVGERSSLEADKVSRAVNSLIRRKLVVRRRHASDRRYFMLSLSAKGAQVNAEISKVRNAIEIDLLSALTSREAQSLFSILEKLQTQADQIFTGKTAWREIVSRVARNCGQGRSRRSLRAA